MTECRQVGQYQNIDLVQEFDGAGGFWHAINEGVEKIEVRDGRLMVQPKE